MREDNKYPLHWGGNEDKDVEALKTMTPQGFEDYDPRDFVSEDEPKYEIVYDEMSCYNWGFSINGVWRSGEVEEGVKQPEEDDMLLDYLLVKLKEGIKRGTCSFKDLVECFQSDDTEFSNSSCDDCGHSGYRQTWKI